MVGLSEDRNTNPSTAKKDWARGNAARGIKVRFRLREVLPRGRLVSNHGIVGIK